MNCVRLSNEKRSSLVLFTIILSTFHSSTVNNVYVDDKKQEFVKKIYETNVKLHHVVGHSSLM